MMQQKGHTGIYILQNEWPKSQLHHLQRIQNSAARIVQSCKKSDHITPHLKQLHCLPVQQWIKFKILTLTDKCLHDLAPQYINDLLSVYNPSHTLRSSPSMQQVVPKTKLSSYRDRSLTYQSMSKWPLLLQIQRSTQDTSVSGVLLNIVYISCPCATEHLWN
jgi:hypothetical protein